MAKIDPKMLGVWRLQSLKRFRNGEFYRYPMGEDATGRLFYSAEGLVAAFLMSGDWVAGRAKPSWDHFMSYSGRWHVEDNAVSHVLDAGSISELIGRVLVRYVSWTEDGNLILSTDGHTAGTGEHSSDTLVWVRESAA
jgi:hypothetical protein